MQNSILGITKTDATNFTEPVDLDEVKDHLAITDSDTNQKIVALITQCRQAVENYLNISIIQRDIILTVDLYSDFIFYYGPVTAITEIKFRTGTDILGVPEYLTLALTDWRSDDFLNFSSTRYGRHRIAYSAGYLPGEVPEDLRLGIMNEIAYRLEHRGDEDSSGGLSEGSRQLINPYWIPCV